MSPDQSTRASRLRENEAESKLAILRNRVEQHLSAVGKTPEGLIGRSAEAARAIEKIIIELSDCAQGNDDIDLKALVAALDDHFRVMRARQRWHDQQIEAFAPLRDALADTEMPDLPEEEVARDYEGHPIGEDGLVAGPGGQRLKPVDDPWPRINAERQRDGGA